MKFIQACFFFYYLKTRKDTFYKNQGMEKDSVYLLLLITREKENESMDQ